MNRRHHILLITCLLSVVDAGAAGRPKLVVLLIGDQVRADYLERFHSALGAHGLRQFRDEGTYFTQAFRDDAVEKTSPGHVLFGSGLTASESGIVNNDWYDVTSSHSVSAAELISGGSRTQLRWFVGHSLAERVHDAWPTSHVIGVSLKDRGALLLGGPGQDEAYWWDSTRKSWVSYGTPPAWLNQFPAPDPMRTADDITEKIAERIIQEWRLGHNAEAPDVLSVSFSQVDLVGHEYGPDASETREAVLTLDRNVGELMRFVKEHVGPDVLWVFSADHGVTPLPEVSSAQGLDAGRVPFDRKALPHPEWIVATATPFIYLDRRVLPSEADREKAARILKPLLLAMKGVDEVYLTDEVEKGNAPMALQRSFFPGRCGDLWVVLKPHYIFSDAPRGTTHGQPTPDDQHVPLGFYGLNVPTRVVSEPVSPETVAPTVLKYLGIPASDLAAPLSFMTQALLSPSATKRCDNDNDKNLKRNGSALAADQSFPGGNHERDHHC